MTKDDSQNPLICPLCFNENSCAVNAKAGCWCINESIPQALIDKVPAQSKNRTCICQNCVRKFKQQNP